MLNWEATTTLEELVKEMIKEDLAIAKNELLMLEKREIKSNSLIDSPPNY